jgi:lipid II:glycine glycyltransferase (peptidoglycan interpeptide bridge formation enzyme)
VTAEDERPGGEMDAVPGARPEGVGSANPWEERWDESDESQPEDAAESQPAVATEVSPVETDEPPPPSQPAALTARLATLDEIEDWDAHTVTSRTGHVYQSRAWGDYRAAHGWRTWHIVFDDGFRLLVVGRPRPVVGGGWAYATKGPIPDRDKAATAGRAAAAAELLRADGMDSFTIDGETPASAGLAPLLKLAGFEPVEEVQASRHRMDIRFAPDDTPNSDEATIFASFNATTRNNIRQAERKGLRVLRLDVGGGRAEDSYGGGALEGFEPVDAGDTAGTEKRLRTFYGMLDATATRRGFALASEDAFLDWAKRSLAAGHMFYLEAEDEEDGPVAGASFLRHGDRVTYSLAGDRSEIRKKHPGAVRLLVWRGIQIALDERRALFDMGGVDTEGARGRPNKGDPTYGMYQFKESFGARWVELTGAHQRTMKPLQNLAGRVAGKLAAIRR